MFFSSRFAADEFDADRSVANGGYGVNRAFHLKIQQLATKISGWFARETLFEGSAVPPQR